MDFYEYGDIIRDYIYYYSLGDKIDKNKFCEYLKSKNIKIDFDTISDILNILNSDEFLKVAKLYCENKWNVHLENVFGKMLDCTIIIPLCLRKQNGNVDCNQISAMIKSLCLEIRHSFNYVILEIFSDLFKYLINFWDLE